MNSTPHFSYSDEFFALPQSGRGGKRIFIVGQQVLLLCNGRAQRLATTGPAPIDNLTTAFGLHPLAESMGPFPLDTTGLKSALGHLYTPCSILLFSTKKHL